MSARGLRKCFRCGRKMPVKQVEQTWPWARPLVGDDWNCKAIDQCSAEMARAAREPTRGRSAP